jgi:hypothetical protein
MKVYALSGFVERASMNYPNPVPMKAIGIIMENLTLSDMYPTSRHAPS